MLTLIAARARNGAIGKDGDIPWHLPEDLAFFQRETRGGAIIMGRRTWESLPVHPLKGRFNIVVSRDSEVAPKADAVVPSLDAALKAAREAGFMRLYGIGGAGIYAGLMAQAHRLLLTDVDLMIDGADTFFPQVDPALWREIDRQELRREGPSAVARELLRV